MLNIAWKTKKKNIAWKRGKEKRGGGGMNWRCGETWPSDRVTHWHYSQSQEVCMYVSSWHKLMFGALLLEMDAVARWGVLILDESVLLDNGWKCVSGVAWNLLLCCQFIQLCFDEWDSRWHRTRTTIVHREPYRRIAWLAQPKRTANRALGVVLIYEEESFFSLFFFKKNS